MHTKLTIMVLFRERDRTGILEAYTEGFICVYTLISLNVYFTRKLLRIKILNRILSTQKTRLLAYVLISCSSIQSSGSHSVLPRPPAPAASGKVLGMQTLGCHYGCQGSAASEPPEGLVKTLVPGLVLNYRSSRSRVELVNEHHRPLSRPLGAAGAGITL